MKNKAFTLVELLVVVLIIGILAAIAVPQYQKAVVKTKYNTIKNMVNSIVMAQRVYNLAHGEYATNFKDLDINVGDTTGSIQNYPWGYCGTLTSAKAFCYNININMEYQVHFSGQRQCVSYNLDLSSPQNQTCMQETGLTEPSYSSSYNSYSYPQLI